MASAQKIISIILRLQDDMSGNLGKSEKAVSSFGANLTKVGAGMTAAFTLPIVAGLTKATQTAIEFESAWAGVAKTVDGSTEQMATLRKELETLATGDSPVAALENAHVELFKIAEAAGQLGVKRQDISAFTETIAALSMTTNIAGEEGAQMIAQFANVAKMPLSEIRNFGDTIATLGNNLATTENDILRFGQRLGNLADINYKPDEILAYGAAMASLGINAELGGTNFMKGAQEIALAAAQGGEALSMMANMTGMTEQAFKQLVETDPAEAMYRFVNALGDMPLEQQVQALDMLNLTGTESRRVFQGLAGNSELLADALDMAGDAFQGNGALMDEAAKRAATTAGQMNILKNNLNQLGNDLGAVLLPVINKIITGLTEAVRWFNGLPQGMKEAIVWVGVLVAAIGPLLMMFGALASAISAIGTLFSAGGLLATVGAALAPLIAAAAPILAVVAAIVAVGVALKMALPLLKQLGEIIGLIVMKVVEGTANMIKGAVLKASEGIASLSAKAGPAMQSAAAATGKHAGIMGKNFLMLGEIIDLLITKLMKAIGNLASGMLEIGKNIVTGLINGINSMIGSLVSKVKEMASKASGAVKSAFGIASPSKLMMKYGENVVAGFNKGIESFGGIGVQTPSLAPAGASPTMTSAPAIGGSMSSGGNIYIENMNVPPGTTQEQVRAIMKEIQKEYKRVGGIR